MPKTQPEFLVPRVSCALSLTVWLVLELFEMSIDIKSHVRPHPLGTGLTPALVLGRFRSRPAIPFVVAYSTMAAGTQAGGVDDARM